jgi:dCMP deaminase
VRRSSAPRRLVVGLTGPNAAGKGEAAAFLVGRGLTYHSLSDVIREEAAARGLPATRENLIALGNELRRSGGSGVLAERVLLRLTGRDVVDSIRNPAEVAALRREPAFVLVGVDAPLEIRYERARARARPGDGSTLAEFAAREARERGGDPTSQQIHRVYEMADLRVDNSGSREDLHRTLAAILASRL